jgi:hypothetical protein
MGHCTLARHVQGQCNKLAACWQEQRHELMPALQRLILHMY